MNKPEWFEIAENDGPGKEFKTSRKLPLLVLLSSVMAVGIGVVAAQNQEGQPVFGNETAAVQNRITSIPVTLVAQKNEPSPVTSSTQKAVTTSSIASMPTRGGEDDEDEDEDREEHDGDGDRNHRGEEDDD